jgi:hypothetical protein
LPTRFENSLRRLRAPDVDDGALWDALHVCHIEGDELGAPESGGDNPTRGERDPGNRLSCVAAGSVVIAAGGFYPREQPLSRPIRRVGRMASIRRKRRWPISFCKEGLEVGWRLSQHGEDPQLDRA